jgi:hypothetical protein
MPHDPYVRLADVEAIAAAVARGFVELWKSLRANPELRDALYQSLLERPFDERR